LVGTSINREISQKASQLSNLRYLSILFVFFLTGTLLFGGGGREIPQREPVTALEPEVTVSSDTALLETGPVTRYGILVLPANAIIHKEGVYTDGTEELFVRYTEEEIIIPGNWVTSVCGSTPVRFTLDNSRLHYAYSSEEGWFVLFDVPEDYKKTCDFIERFLQRLRYFKSVAKESESVPFPAIVEVPEG